MSHLGGFYTTVNHKLKGYAPDVYDLLSCVEHKEIFLEK